MTFLAMSTAIARAETVSSVLEDIGLIGVWSADCNQPASPSVPRSIYVALPGGAAISHLRIGPEENPRFDYTISSVGRIAANRIQMHLGNDDAAFDLILEVQGDRYRSFRSVQADGTALIENGIVIALGRETIWQQRCGN